MQCCGKLISDFWDILKAQIRHSKHLLWGRICFQNKFFLLLNNGDIIQLLVSISHYSQRSSADFLELLLKRRHLKNLKKSANKFKVNQYNNKNDIIDFSFDLLINSFWKYVSNNLIRILYNFYFIFRCRFLKLTS